MATKRAKMHLHDKSMQVGASPRAREALSTPLPNYRASAPRLRRYPALLTFGHNTSDPNIWVTDRTNDAGGRVSPLARFREAAQNDTASTSTKNQEDLPMKYLIAAAIAFATLASVTAAEAHHHHWRHHHHHHMM